MIFHKKKQTNLKILKKIPSDSLPLTFEKNRLASLANKTVSLLIDSGHKSLKRISMDFLCKSCFWNAGWKNKNVSVLLLKLMASDQ